MTEVEWLASSDPQPMLEFLRGKVSDRKLRLFAVGCCRRIWHLLENQFRREVVEIADQYSDGAVSQQQFEEARNAADAARREAAFQARLQDLGQRGAYRTMWIARAPAMTTSANAYEAAEQTARSTAEAIDELGTAPLQRLEEPPEARSKQNEQREQAALLRHIFGNPFRPFPAHDYWPSTVVQLANALYNGEDCGFALHDALLEAGHPEVAEHFRAEETHPKGCWVVDMVTGRQ